MDRLRFQIMRGVYEGSRYVDWRLHALLRRLGFSVPAPPWMPERYAFDRGLNALTFHWGVERTLSRYRR